MFCNVFSSSHFKSLQNVLLFSFRTLGDRVGEAKASGNLGNTLKVLGKFDEAIACCHRHLDLSRELKDRVRSRGQLFKIKQHL